MSNSVVVRTESDSGGIWVIPPKRQGFVSEHVRKGIDNGIEQVGDTRCVEPSVVDVTTEVNRGLWNEVQELAKNVKGDTVKF